jgi:putative ABC transport system substrate-binding protein
MAGRRRWLRFGALLLALPMRAVAQPTGRPPRVGLVTSTYPGPRSEAFLLGLREAGYVLGRDIDVDLRFAEGRPERFSVLVDELLQLKVDVLVVGSTLGARAAMRATNTVPIVFAAASDPVAGGIVTSLARPGGNITGFSLAIGDGFAGKWLELLKELVPRVDRVAALWTPSNAAAAGYLRELQVAAGKLGVKLDAHQAMDVSALDTTLAAVAGGGTQALIVMPSPFAASQQHRLVRFAAERRLPAMYFAEEFVDAGGLISYGPSYPEAYRAAAGYVARILRSARVGDLPVQQPTRFDLVVNLATARTLGIDVPRSLLIRVARVVD